MVKVMKRVDKVTLITQTQTLDSIGQPTMTETTSSVICTVLADSRAEWVAAQQRSLSPAAVVKVFSRDFAGQHLAEFGGKRYEIYRTYPADDYVELYLGERVGDLNVTGS